LFLVDASSTSPLLQIESTPMQYGYWSPLLRATVPCDPPTGRIAHAPTAPHLTTTLHSSVSRGAHSYVYNNRLLAHIQRKRGT
jgi:hypothetical protein